jgi:peptidoglycan/LPS O-acetylase OafA/YrhL
VKPATQESSRLRELDSLRGIAALAIVFWHYSQHFQAFPLFGLLQPFYRAGYYSVDFFFVLSGLVLARAYLKQERRLHFTDNAMRRIARIYPLHLVTLLCVAAGTGDGSLARPGTILHVQVSVFRTVFGFFVGVLLHQFAFREREGEVPASPPWTFDLAFACTAAVLVLSGLSYRFLERAIQDRLNAWWAARRGRSIRWRA